MQSMLFTSRTRNAFAMLVSVLALSAAVAYVGSSSAIAAKVTANYQRASRTLVEGVVKLPNGHPDRNGEVVLVFRDAGGRMIERVVVKVNRRGQFNVVPPNRAQSVALTVYMRPGRNAPHGSRTFGLVSGEALSVTIVFDNTGEGVIPVLFPY